MVLSERWVQGPDRLGVFLEIAAVACMEGILYPVSG